MDAIPRSQDHHGPIFNKESIETIYVTLHQVLSFNIGNMDSSRSGPRDRRRNVEKFQLTEEERKVLRECRMNSLFRGLPAGLVSALITTFAIRTGNFPHLASWSRFYYAASFTGGLLFGVASYRRTCLEKIMQLENSALADQVREYFRRAGVEYTGPHKNDTGFDDSVASTGSDYRSLSDSTPTSESTLHSSRSNDKENNLVGSNDWQNTKQEESRLTSFEELRKQNRQKWSQDQYPVRSSKKMDLSNEDKRLTANDEDSSHHVPEASHQRQPQVSTGVIRRNKYGDPIE